MPGWLPRSFALLSAAAAVAWGQAALPPAHVRGTVVDSVTGAPLPRVHVTLQATVNGAPMLFGALTGGDGTFSIDGLPPAAWTAQAERVGYFMSAGSSQVELQPDETRPDVTLKLTPTGGIAGQVIGSDGEPVERVTVMAEGSDHPRFATTDDEGRYRLWGLPPGRYRVRAGTAFNPAMLRSPVPAVRDAAAYFPARVRVNPGADTMGIDIRLREVPVVRVGGRVTGIEEGTGIVVIRQSADFSSQVPLRKDGTFEFVGLDPGRYALHAEVLGAASHSPPRSAGVEIEVAGADLKGIELRIVPPVDIAGRLEFDDEGARRALRGRRISLSDEGSAVGAVRPLDADTGTFRLVSVPPGRYRVELLPGDVYVKSMRYGAVAVDGSLLDLSNATPGAGLTVVLSSGVGSVAGSVDSPGIRVVVTFADGSNRTRETISGADGSWRIGDLPPGSYRASIDGEDEERAFELHAGEAVTLRSAQLR